MMHYSTRARILLSSGSIALSMAMLLPSAAKADCLPNFDGSIVTCQAVDPDGYTAGNSVTINVNSGASVLDTLTLGTPGQVNNEGTITVVGTAISTGGGAGVANATLGVLTGDTLMGATTGTQLNVFENFGTVTGDLISSGALDFTNTDSFTGDVSATGALTFLNDSTGTFTGNVSADGDTDFTNDGTFTGDLTLGDGDDFVTNTGSFTGNIDMGAGENVIGFDSGTQVPSGTLTADTAGDSTLILFGATSEALNLTVTNFDILYKTGTGTWELVGAVTLDDEIIVDDGTLLVTDADFIGANTVTNDATIVFDNTVGGTFSGDMSGEGAVEIGGGGASVTIFSGTNTYTGGTTILDGTLQVSGGAALADNGDVTVTTPGILDVAADEAIGSLNGDGSVTLSGGDLSIGEGSFSGIISGANGLVKTGEGTLTLTGINTYTGGVTVEDGELVGTTDSLKGDIVNDGNVTFDQTASGSYIGNLSGTGSLTKTGTGAVTLTGTNSYSGATTISGGALVSSGTGIGDASAVTIDTGATLTLLADETVGSLAGAGTLGMGAFTLTAGGDNSSTTFSGAATGAGLTKTGTGTLTLSGTGTLTGALAASGGTLSVTGTYAALTATAASGATLDIGSTGALTATVTGATGSTVRVNGTLTGDLTNNGTLYGAGTVNGMVTNNGTMRPGNSPGIFTVNGSFVQGASATLNAELTATATAGTGYDQVLVTGIPGTAALDGTLALAPSAGLYVSGTTYDVVRAEGGITGDFDTITGATLSPFISFADTGIVTLTGAEQVYRLTVARTSYATGMGVGATPNQIATANGFQGLVAGATGDAATLVSSVDTMTAAQAQAFFDEASPEPYGAYATALVDQGDLFTRQVALHQTDGMARGAWIRLYGQGGEGKADDFRFGTDHDVTGVAGGVDFVSNDIYHFGAALGYAEGPLDYELGNSEGDSKSWQVGVYGGYKAGPISANVQFAYVDFSADVTRSVGSRFASTDVNGNLWKVIGTLGYEMGGEDGMIRPFIGIDYSNGKIKGFTETGANAASLTVGSIDADETDLMAGIDLAGQFGGISPYGRLTYRYNLDGGNRNIDALFNGNALTAFTVSAIAPGKSQFDVDAGLRFGVGPAVNLSLGYQGTFRNDLTTHGVNAGIRFAF